MKEINVQMKIVKMNNFIQNNKLENEISKLKIKCLICKQEMKKKDFEDHLIQNHKNKCSECKFVRINEEKDNHKLECKPFILKQFNYFKEKLYFLQKQNNELKQSFKSFLKTI